MIAKKTSKNQFTLPKKVAERFPDVEYFEVSLDNDRIVLAPVRLNGLERIQRRLADLGLSEKDVRDAVIWARKSPQ
jgi:hypothetical protein